MKVELNELANVKGIGQKTLQRIREYKLADEGYISKYDPELHLDINSVNKGDCLELMNGIEDKSVDMILADLPYGTTQNKWDSIINLDKLWLQYERIIKDNGVIILTASEPFTSKLVLSNSKLFKYDLVWDKKRGSDFLNAKRKPLKSHENILVFYKELPNYNPQFWYSEPYKKTKNGSLSNNYGNRGSAISESKDGRRYPLTINKFIRDSSREHPTQKPVALFEYLIKTYTNKNDLVLDNTAGSGTTGVAAKNLNRNYILIEQEQKYIDVINERLG